MAETPLTQPTIVDDLVRRRDELADEVTRSRQACQAAERDASPAVAEVSALLDIADEFVQTDHQVLTARAEEERRALKHHRARTAYPVAALIAAAGGLVCVLSVAGSLSAWRVILGVGLILVAGLLAAAQGLTPWGADPGVAGFTAVCAAIGLAGAFGWPWTWLSIGIAVAAGGPLLVLAPTLVPAESEGDRDE